MKKWTWVYKLKKYSVLDGDGKEICVTFSRAGSFRIVREQNYLIDEINRLKSEVNAGT